jgi:hypothetical protein
VSEDRQDVYNVEVYTNLASCIAATMQCVGVTQWEEVDINDIEVASKEAILFSYIYLDAATAATTAYCLHISSCGSTSEKLSSLQKIRALRQCSHISCHNIAVVAALSAAPSPLTEWVWQQPVAH